MTENERQEHEELEQMPGRKPTYVYSEEEAREMRIANTTQGRKGCRLHRLNLALSDDMYDYVRTMARASGLTITDYMQRIVSRHMAENTELYEKAKAFRNAL